MASEQKKLMSSPEYNSYTISSEVNIYFVLVATRSYIAFTSVICHSDCHLTTGVPFQRYLTRRRKCMDTFWRFLRVVLLLFNLDFSQLVSFFCKLEWTAALIECHERAPCTEDHWLWSRFLLNKTLHFGLFFTKPYNIPP